MPDFLENKKVLFITTKNLDYIRNSQEIALLKGETDALTVIGSPEKSYAKRLAHVWRRLLGVRMKEYDAVFVGFAPQLIVPFWRRLRKKELTIDFFISMYDTFVCDRKKFKAGSLPARLLKRLDQKTLKLADHIITDTKAHGRYFVEELGADSAKETVLYLEADQTIYYPRKQEKQPDMQDKFLVLYFGSVLPLQGVQVILDAAQLLADRKDILFHIIGPVGKELKKPESGQIRYTEWLSQEKLAEAIAQADLCLAGHFNDQIAKARRTIPGKAYIYRAMEKKMILGDNPANHELFDDGDSQAVFVKMGDPGALAGAVEKQAEEWRQTLSGRKTQ